MAWRRRTVTAALLCGLTALPGLVWSAAAGARTADPDGSLQQVITLRVGDLPPGEFAWSIDDGGTVTLSQASNAGGYLQAVGSLAPVSVSDTRPDAPGWSMAGQVQNFSGGLSGKHLGWAPQVLVEGAGAVPGIEVPPGLTDGRGLLDSAVLAHAVSGYERGTAVLGAALDVRVPTSTAPGTYTAILTLTALS
jgi:hypothetical protein